MEFKLLQYLEAINIRKTQVKQNAIEFVLLAQQHTVTPFVGNNRFKSISVGDTQQDFGKSNIVFDDQYGLITFVNGSSVIGYKCV